MRKYGSLLGGCLALALALCGSMAYADESPQGFKGGYEVASPDVHGYGYTVSAAERHPELKTSYQERQGSFGLVTMSGKHIPKGAGYVLREVKPFSASSIRSEQSHS